MPVKPITAHEVHSICALEHLDERTVRRAYTNGTVRAASLERIERAARALGISTPRQAAVAISFLTGAIA
ncbi:MAG: hypothetical protein ABW061_11730 [Polyangiaceae bacterium]